MKKFILLLFLFITFAQAQNRDVTLQLSWKNQFQFAGYYIAKEKGFYKEVGLDVAIKEYDLHRENAKDVSLEQVEFSIGHSSLILDKLNDYPNIVLLAAISQSSPLVLLSKKREDITSLDDIAGKKIMMSRDQTSTASINAMLSSEHLDKDSYKIIDTSFNPIDLINGNADLMMAYSSNEPFTLSQKGIAYTIFDPKDYDFDFYSDILFTSSQMIKNNPDTVKAFYTASMRGWEYAYDNIDESVEIILKYYNTQLRSKKALLFEANTLKKLAYVDGVKFGEITELRLKEMVNTYRLLGLLEKNRKIDFHDFIYKVAYESNATQHSTLIKDKTKFNYDFIDTLYFKIFLLILILTLLISLYFKLKMDKILAKKTMLLKKQNEIFDHNISSCRTDTHGVILSVSKAFCQGCGYTEDELVGNRHNMLKGKNTSKSLYKDLWLTITSAHEWRGDFENIKKDGSSYWINALISPVFDKDNKIIAYDAIASDITLKKVLEAFNEKLENEVKERTLELEKLAITDKLTGIYNRVKIDEKMLYHYNAFLRYNTIYSIIIFDIDFFKNVNDSFGHQVGDEILKELANILKTNIRSTDILGRWGGEEFVIISPNTDIDGAYMLAENIRVAIEKTVFDNVENITLSAGISTISASMSNEEEILLEADKALYKAKENGRNRVEK